MGSISGDCYPVCSFAKCFLRPHYSSSWSGKYYALCLVNNLLWGVMTKLFWPAFFVAFLFSPTLNATLANDIALIEKKLEATLGWIPAQPLSHRAESLKSCRKTLQIMRGLDHFSGPLPQLMLSTLVHSFWAEITQIQNSVDRNTALKIDRIVDDLFAILRK